MQIAERTFLVSGGASGLGAACTRMLVEAGGKVVIADINQEAGRSLEAELGDVGRFVATDVTRAEDVRAAVDCGVEHFNGLHGAIACAGILDAGRAVGREGPHDLDRFRRVIDVNLCGTFNLVRLAAHLMSTNEPDEEGERGVIVMTSSVAAMDGQIGQAAYAASKGGVASMTLPLARELGRHGIRIASIAPGVFETPMMAPVDDQLRESLAAQIPFPKRFGRPEEFAALARHVIENSMINGAVLRLDGAIRMGPQ